MDGRELFRAKLFRRAFAYTLIPASIVLVAAVTVVAAYQRSLEATSIDRFAAAFSGVVQNLENSMAEVDSGVTMLSYDGVFREIFREERPLPDTAFYRLGQLSERLASLELSHTIIQDAFVISWPNNQVVSGKGAFRIDYFFDRYLAFERYPPSFWRNTRTVRQNPLLLPPTAVTRTTSMLSVWETAIPVVYHRVGNYYSRNAVGLAINADSVDELIQPAGVYPSAESYVVRAGKHPPGVRDVVASTKADVSEAFLHDLMDTNAESRQDEYRQDEYRTIAGMPYLVYRASFDAGLLRGYQLLTAIPRSAVVANRGSLQLLLVGIGLIVILGTLFVAYVAGVHMYGPLSRIVNLFGGQSPDTATRVADEYEFVRRNVQALIKDRSQLSETLSTVASAAREQRFVRLLLGMTEGEDVSEILESGFPPPRNPLFTAIAVFAHAADDASSTGLAEGFHDRFRDVVAALSDEHIRMTAVTIDTSFFGIIVNHGVAVSTEMIATVASDIIRRVGEGHDSVDLLVGIGSSHGGSETLPRSYQESVSALSRAGAGHERSIAIYRETEKPAAYTYTAADESRLINLLEAGFTERAQEQLEHVVANNAGTTDRSALRELYLQVYQTVVRVAYLRGSPPQELLGTGYVNPLSPVFATAPHKLRHQVEILTQRLGNRIQESHGRFDLPRILSYIQEHYRDQIFLESVSDVFQLSSRYVSRAFKESMGVSFGRYLARLRVEEAKRLLTTEDAAVQQVAERVGFGSRNTFTRVFKRMEGVTPTQYRVVERNRNIG